MSSLFVDEDPIDTDPIVESIPLVLGRLPEGKALHVFQYPGRPCTRPITAAHVSIKPESRFVEVKVPLDVSKFFDAEKLTSWGESIGEQSLQGVLDRTDGSLYAAQIVPGQNGGKKCVLVPIHSTAQLRTSFKYIDDIDNAANTQRKETAEKPANIQILQTSAKGQHPENATQALGESLRHVKRFNEESWCNLRWASDDAVREELAGASEEVLEVIGGRDEYLGKLLE